MHRVCYLMTVIVVCTAANPVKQNATSDLDVARKPHEFRPSFVKRDIQAPLVRAHKDRVEGEYIVKLRDDITVEDMATLQETLLQLVEKDELHVDIHSNITTLMKCLCVSMLDEAVEMLRWLDEVDFIEENKLVYADAINSIPWGLDRIDQVYPPLDGRYNSALGNGSQVNVFVVDTGIRFSHHEFGGRASSFYDAMEDGLEGGDCDGHGTHCAGIIGGENVGVAPGVNLYSVRSLNCSGNGTAIMLIEAMDVIAKSNMTPAVVSMSLGGPYSELINLAMTRLVNAGYIVVAAAGNNAYPACAVSPASSDEVISVGATNISDFMEHYSNYGSCVNILAPGSNIFSSFPLNDSSYAFASGTSMAAPHVAGVAAILLEQDPTLTQDQVKRILLNSARSGVVTLSAVPDVYYEATPNELLGIPQDASIPPPTPPSVHRYMCEDTCDHAMDGECDDGGHGAQHFVCYYGTDCFDCGPRRM